MEQDQACFEIVQFISGMKPSLVRLEGFDGVGKSMIGAQVAAVTGATYVDSDDFVSAFDDPPPYTECVDLDRLQSELSAGLSKGWVVFAAVCSQEIFPGESINIYIKRVSFSTPELPLWHRELDLEDPPPSLEPHRSIHLYHLKYRPHEGAHLVLELPDVGQTLEGTVP